LRTTPVTPPLPAGIREAAVQQAIDLARRQVLDKPDSAKDWGHLGLLLLAHQLEHDADTCLAQAARLDPTEPMWAYARASIAAKRDPDQVVPLLRQAEAAGASWRDDARAILGLELAEALLQRGNLDEAAALFQQEGDRMPGHARAALGLGQIAAARGNQETARELLTGARASPFARKKATVRLASLARARGDKAAADAFEQEIAEWPADPPWPDPLRDALVHMEVGRRARDRLAARLEQEYKHAEAAQLYLQQIAEQPTLEAYVGAGLNLARLKDYDRALPLLRKAVQLDPRSAQAHYPLALVLFERAERALLASRWSLFGASTAASSTSPLGPDPLLAASAWFRGGIELWPPTGPAKEGLREALEHARLAAELRPEHAEAYLFWGLALKHLGESAEAVGPLRKGVARRPTSFELQLALGEVLLETGQVGEAQTHLDHARRLDPNDPRGAQALERLRRKKATGPG
jgi:tetratricopeptide (TPR) repeat protein